MDRKSKLFVNVAASFALLFGTAFGRADEPNPKPDDQRDLDRLAAIWQGNVSKVKSAHIQYHSLARTTSKRVTRDVLLKLLDIADFANRPDDAKLLSETLGLDIRPEQAAWGEGELYLAGTKVRVNSDYEGRRLGEDVWNDTVRIRFDRLNDQITIGGSSGRKTGMMTFNDLRVIPRLENQPAATIERRSADGLSVRIGPKQFVVDDDTGFVQSVRIGSAQDFTEICQRGRVPYPNGIVFPAAIITCRYARSGLSFIGIDVIDTATFNEPIKDDVFAVSAPIGSKVFDHRLDRNKSAYFTRIDAPVAGIISEIDKRHTAFHADIMRQIADLKGQIDSLRKVENPDVGNQAKQQELRQEIIDLRRKL
jgi:hypothetical protein